LGEEAAVDRKRMPGDEARLIRTGVFANENAKWIFESPHETLRYQFEVA
jgi:hypothetical protein